MLREIFQFLHGCGWILHGNQTDAFQPFWIRREVFFDQPAIDRMAHRGGQGFLGRAVNHERDRGAEDDRDIDTFFIHVGQAL